MRTGFICVPKSGTHIIVLHRNITGKHLPLYDEPGVFTPPEKAIRIINKYKGDFVGHLTYSNTIRDWFKNNNIRTVFVHRDLRDVALSLSRWVVKKPKSEFNIEIKPGVRLRESDDILLDSIHMVFGWWEHFKSWLQYADATYTFEELRGAALLMGNEEGSKTFSSGQSGGWRWSFEPHHIELAEQYMMGFDKPYTM